MFKLPTFKPLRLLLLVACASLVLCCTPPRPVSANDRDGYWRNYWRWYDRSYRPYYHRRYRSYNNPYYRGYRYNYGPGVYQYRYPHRGGSHRYYHPHGGVQVGPLRFEYWH